MKTILTILLTFISLNISAPPDDRIDILRFEPYNIYDKLIDAVVKVESGGDVYAFNASEGAVGAFQVRQCRIDHYNYLTGSKMSLADMYDYDKAKQVFLFFAVGKSFERASKEWNGSGYMTEIYWRKIKANL